MMKHIIHFEQLVEAINHGADIITPNTRISQELTQKYAKTTNKKVIAKPRIRPFSQYMSELFYQVRTSFEKSPILLTQIQSHILWQTVISNQMDTYSIDGLVSNIIKAWNHCYQWLVEIDKKTFSYNTETLSFYQWTKNYRKKLQEMNAIDETLIYDTIKDNLPQCTFATIWALFDEFTPLQLELISKNPNQHCVYEPNSVNQTCQLIVTDTKEQEFSALIKWLKQLLDEQVTPIGIVIPDLNQNHQILSRQLNNHFERSDYNISLGQPLKEVPLIGQALSFLELNPNQLSNKQVNLLLFSPYIGDAENEFLQRQECYNKIELLREPIVKLDTLIKAIGDTCPKLVERLKTIKPFDRQVKYPCSKWANRFKSRLNTLGFPGEIGLNSANFQAYARFERLFDEFCQLSLVNSYTTFEKAHDLLIQLAQKTLFQPQNTSAKVHVLGLLEAAGLEFSHLWIMGITDECLPQPSQLSPFIPYAVQKQWLMPHSSTQKEYEYSQKLLKRLSNSSKQCLFSYARYQDDKEAQISPLLVHIPIKTLNQVDESNKKQIATEKINENYQLELLNNETVGGGTFILKDQALCPFRAFARHRLKAQTGIEAQEGLDALDRGLLIHRVLELVWQQLKTQKRLLFISVNDLSQVISLAIEQALSSLIDTRPETMNPTCQQLEKQRLTKLVHRWLELEKQRPCFEVIAQEEWQQLELSGLNLNMRVDRVDKLANGEKWVIDYKTGMPSPNEWFEHRISEPQLPLYALSDEQITGLVFAQLKTNELKFKGVAKDPEHVNGIINIDKKAESWQEQKELWHQQLSQLASEFLQGDIQRSPKKQSTCSNCEFMILCRNRT
jgi:ATP-dependent helicase/nuclease subunit B